jgi:hypothetical protein
MNRRITSASSCIVYDESGDLIVTYALATA